MHKLTKIIVNLFSCWIYDPCVCTDCKPAKEFKNPQVYENHWKSTHTTGSTVLQREPNGGLTVAVPLPFYGTLKQWEE